MNQTITPKRAAQIHAKLLAKAQAKAKETTMTQTNPIPNLDHQIHHAELLNAVAKAIEPFLGRTEAHRAEEVAEAVLKVIRGDRS